MCGEIVMVYDDTGAVLPYIVPEERYVTYCQETEVTEKLPRKYMSLEEARKLPDYLLIKLIKELHRSKSTIGIYNKLRDVLLNERGYAEKKGYKSRKRELKGRERGLKGRE